MGTPILTSPRFRFALHLLLALALFMPLLVWSPAQAAPDEPTGGPVETDTATAASISYPYLRPMFMAMIRRHNLIIYGAGFSKQHTIQVGVSKRKPWQWVILGSTRSSRSGRVVTTLPLPSSLWGERILLVCLRDTTTEKITCSTAYHR